MPNPIEVTIRGNDQTQAAFTSAKAAAQQFKDAESSALSQHTDDIHRARGAAMLLGEEFGVRIPRELRGLMAHSQAVGSALSAMLPVGAAIGFLEVTDKIIDKFGEMATAISGFSEAEQQAMQKAFANANAYLKLEEAQLQTIRAKQLANAGSDDERIALRQQFALEDVARQRDAIAEARRQMEEAQRLADEFSRFNAAQESNREGGPFSGNKIVSLFAPGLGAWRDIKKFLDDVESTQKKHAEAIISATEATNRYYEAQAKGETTLQGVIKVQEDYNKALADAKKKADEAYKKSLEEAMDRAAQAASFLLGKMDDHVKKIAEVKNATKDLNPAQALDQAESELRFWEIAFKLKPEDKGLILEAVSFWREQVEAQNKRLNTEIGAAGVEAGKKWGENFADEAAKAGEKLLPKFGPSLIRKGDIVGENVGQDPRLLLVSSSKMDELTPRMQKIKSISQEIGGEFSNIFAEMVDGTHSVSEAFANMAKSVAASIASMIAKMLIMAAVERIIGAAIGAISPAFHARTAATPMGFDNTGAYVIDTRAGGGPVMANMPYLIGERGPELFVPNSSGTVIPNGAFGGSGVQVNIINNSSAEVRQTQSQPQFDGKKYIIGVVLEDVAQNGQLGQMLRTR